MTEEILMACPVEARTPPVNVMIDHDQSVPVRQEYYVDTVTGMIEHLRTVHYWSDAQIREWLAQIL